MDSLALYHLLLDYRRAHPLDLHIAHIDHRWRKESAHEAALLQAMVQRDGLSFHLKVLERDMPLHNLEEAGRNARLQFFDEICKKTGCQAVLLGHHADDRAETILKQVLEGASLTHGGGLRSVNKVEGVEIWRPLLPIRRKAIADFSIERGLSPFVDVTNSDEYFLRARLRHTVIPTLSKTFGKEVTSGLCAIAEEAEALKDYLEERLALVLDAIQESPFGCMLDLSDCLPPHEFEQKYVVRALSRRVGCFLSKSMLGQICVWLTRGEANKEVSVQGVTLYVDRKRLFAWRTSPTLDSWVVEVKSGCGHGLKTSWRNVVTGKFEVPLPEGPYKLQKADPQSIFKGKKLDEWWQEHKVPTFLRYRVPVLWVGSEVVGEFLTGRGSDIDKPSQTHICVSV